MGKVLAFKPVEKTDKDEKSYSFEEIIAMNEAKKEKAALDRRSANNALIRSQRLIKPEKNVF